MTSLEMITAFVDTSYVLSKESKTFHSSAPRALKERNMFYKSSLCHSCVLLTPCSRVLLEKLTSSQLVKKFPHCMEPEYSLPCLQVPTTSPYPQPDQSSPCALIPVSEDPS